MSLEFNKVRAFPVRLVTLFGRPGSGKSTVGDGLANHFGFVHIALGRELQKADVLADIGISADSMAQAVATGRTIDDPRLYPWLDARIQASAAPVVVDGYPRIASALPFFNALAVRLAGEGGQTVALHLEAARETADTRVVLRDRANDRGVGMDRRNAEFDRVQRPLLHQLTDAVRCITANAGLGEGDVLAAVATKLGLTA